MNMSVWRRKAKREFRIRQPSGAAEAVRCLTRELSAKDTRANFKVIGWGQHAPPAKAWSHFWPRDPHCTDWEWSANWQVEKAHTRFIGKVDGGSTTPLLSSLRAGATRATVRA